MTQLYKDIMEAMMKVPFKKGSEGELHDDYPGYVEAAASVCKRYIEKAWEDGCDTGMALASSQSATDSIIESEKKIWLSENGIEEKNGSPISMAEQRRKDHEKNCGSEKKQEQV